MKNINKSKLNLTIDIIMFIVMMAIAGIGFLIKYVLVPGFKRNEIYGSNVELYHWGIDRHQWGSIHLIFSFVLLFLLVLHIILHWKQIVAIFKKMVETKAMRIVLTVVFILISLLFAVAPLFIKPEVAEGDDHHSHGHTNFQQHQQMENPDTLQIEPHHSQAVHHKQETATADITGKMTLNEVAAKYNLTIAELCEYIGIPEYEAGEQLGRLKKAYGFDMHSLREYIEEQIQND